MKKLISLFLLLAPFFPSLGQKYFTLTETGLKPSGDPEARFIVIEKAGSQQELFTTFKSFVAGYFVSPKDVMSEVDNSMITINGISTDDIMAKKALGYIQIKMNYTIVFHFKDGRVRVDVPSINKMTGESSSTIWQLTLTKDDDYDLNYDRFVIFDKGKVKAEPAKENIETFFNTFIEKAISYTPASSEKW